LITPATLVLTLLVLVPLGLFLVYSFMTGAFYRVTGPFTLDNYVTAISSEVNHTLAWNSLVIGVASAGISTALGLPVAYWLRFRAGRLLVPALFLVTLTMFASYLVRIYAWRSILGEQGALNTLLTSLGLDEPLSFLLFTKAAVVLALVHIALPYVILTMYAAMLPLEPRHLECAQDLGADSITRWRRVILPLMAAPIAATFLFNFVLSSSEFVAPQFLGGPDGSMIGVQVQNYFKGIGNFARGAALSVLMLIVYLACYGLVRLVLRSRRLHDIKWTA
jgi:spermidine/putrescine transport system permease protein